MGKAEFMSPKAIANRMKAKGLQKLRWFCQLCNKQCRDENGFKCHADSEGHKRQLSLFASRPGKFLDQFSHEFEKTFLDELKRRFGSKRVHANLVYNEYIRDKFHTHMNSTVWTTLTGFVKHLGKTGKCIVDETPKGWYIAYVNRDPEAIARQEAQAKKEKMDVDDEDRNRMMIEKRLFELAKLGIEPPAEGEEGAENAEDEPVFDPEKPHETIKFSLVRPGAVKVEEVPTPSEAANATTTTTSTPSTTSSTSEDSTPSIKPEPSEGDEATRDSSTSTSSTSTSSTSTSSSTSPSESTPTRSSVPTPSTTDSKAGIKPVLKPVNPFEAAAKSIKESKEKDEHRDKDNKRKKSAMEELREAEERDREKRNRRDYWIVPGIVVKVMNKTLAGGKYYKAKGVVQEVIDKYVAQIKIVELGDVLKLDQSQLETVIPQVGGKVKMVNGAWRGETATLQGLDVDNFSAKVKLTSGPSGGKVLPSVPYEDICKTATQ